jgi:hypothetical protein
MQRSLTPWLVIAITLVSTRLAAESTSLDPNALGSRTNEAQATSYIYVDAAAPWASDSNPGTQVRPLKTLNAAAQLATAYNANGVGVRVEIGPGTYRESIALASTGRETPAPIVFEATTAGTVVLSGAEAWTDWRSDAPSGVFAHDWPYAFGLAPYPTGWDCCVVLSDLMRRREMLFLNGQRLRQVLAKSDLIDGSFFVAESLHKVYVRPPAGVSMARATVEVSVRSPLFLVQGRSNVVIRGLVFRHDNSGVGSTAALTINDSSDIRIEDCRMEWNNYRGLSLADVDHVTVRRTVSNSNGSGGVAGWKMHSVLFADNETSFNNWRGNESGFTEWDPAGTKLMLLRDTLILREKLDRNLSYGLWLDTDCANVSIQAVTATSNLNDGVMLEAVQGPIEVTSSTMAGNARSGFLLANAANVDFHSNTVTENGRYQIYVSGVPSGRVVQDFETGQDYLIASRNLTLASNLVKADTIGMTLIATTLPEGAWRALVDSLSSDWNTWLHGTDRSPFRWANGLAIDFVTWQSWTSQDRHSCC